MGRSSHRIKFLSIPHKDRKGNSGYLSVLFILIFLKKKLRNLISAIEKI